MVKPLQNHWNGIYMAQPVTALGWYETQPGPSLALLAHCSLAPDDPVLDVGAGASTFIDSLLALGFRQVIAADLSEVALTRLKERLGPELASQVTWLVDDITQPARLDQLSDIALWHDRALLHFLVEPEQRQAYGTTLRQVVRSGGYALIAAYALTGANRCAGLPVQNYSREMLAELVAPEFTVVDSLDYTFQMPSGDLRPFIYMLFQKRASGAKPLPQS